MNHGMSSTCVATMSEHHFGRSHYRSSSLESADEREYKKAVQFLRSFHLRGSARPLEVIHEEEREGFNQQRQETVSQSPTSMRRQIKAENLQSLLSEPPHQPASEQLQRSGSAEAATAISASTPDIESHRTALPRSESKESTSYSKPPLASRRSFRTKALLVWGRR